MKTFVVLLAVVAVGLAAVLPKHYDGYPDMSDIDYSSLQASDSNEEDEYLMKLPEYSVKRPEFISAKASEYPGEDEDIFSDKHPYPESEKNWPMMMDMRDFCNGKSFIPIFFGDCRATDLLKYAEEALRMFICDPAAQEQRPGDIFN